MSENSDKEKKLKEIQERLAEIQGKSTGPKVGNSPKKETSPKPSPKKAEQKPPVKQTAAKKVVEEKKTDQ